MTQQEIFNNMTKGELSVYLSNEGEHTYLTDARLIVDGSKGNTFCEFHHLSQKYLPQFHRENVEANMAAIVSAVNNTYGKGINPEAVEDLKNICQELSGLTPENTSFDTLFDALDRLIPDAIKALEKAKL